MVDMAKMYYENDADLSAISDLSIGIVGYGSQGHAHALNLHDNGLNVQVGLYEGSKSWAKAESNGLKVGVVADVARDSDIVMMLIPDTSMAEVYRASVEPHLEPRRHADVRPRVQHPLQDGSPSRDGRRLHGGAQSARP